MADKRSSDAPHPWTVEGVRLAMLGEQDAEGMVRISPLVLRDVFDALAPAAGRRERWLCERCGAPSVGRTLDDVDLCAKHAPPVQ